MKFFVGMHHPADADSVERAFISVNAVRGRKKRIPSSEFILDSAAFSELARYGRYRHGPAEYAAEVNRLAAINSGMIAAVSQDFMCEQFLLEKTGLTVADHQRLTIERYDALRALVTGTYLMPVLQGYSLQSYLDHIDQYGARLQTGMYVGIGSICKRNADVQQIEAILTAIKRKRPDLRLHGFGLKTTALASQRVRDCLESADSMAWSYAARREGRDRNSPREAVKFEAAIAAMPMQGYLNLELEGEPMKLRQALEILLDMSGRYGENTEEGFNRRVRPDDSDAMCATLIDQGEAQTPADVIEIRDLWQAHKIISQMLESTKAGDRLAQFDETEI
jgi:hypothetical protein